MGFRERLRAKFGRRSKDSSPVQKPPTGEQPLDAQLEPKPEPISKPSVEPVQETARDLWSFAWDAFERDNPKEAKALTSFTADSGSELVGHGKDPQSVRDGYQIANAISVAYDKHKQKHETSIQIKEAFHRIVSTLEKGSDLIAAATSANSIAASVWTGVSLIIPILLQPGNQNEAAMTTTRQVVELMQSYQSYQRLLENEDQTLVGYACKKIVDLYSTVFLFEAKLVIHRGRNVAHRLVDNMTNDWLDISSTLTSIDIAFKVQMDVVRDCWQRAEQRRCELRDNNQLVDNIITALRVDMQPPKAKRQAGTCEWFLRRPEFLSWKLKKHGLLWVTADPGCGKSVLAKYLVESRFELLDKPSKDVIVGSYFFASGQANSSATLAICSLLNQLLAETPNCASTVLTFCKKRGMEVKDLKTSPLSLVWSIFLDVISAFPPERQVICVLDALDECDQGSMEELLEIFDKVYRKQRRQTETTDDLSLKFLVTSRPYEEIRMGLRRIIKITPDVRIDAAEELDSLKAEIDTVIEQRVKDIGDEKDMDAGSQEALLKALKATEHRTYLWLYLVLQRFKSEWKHAGQDISNFINTLPRSVEREYGRILMKMAPDTQEDASAIFQMMIAALRPLTADEMYHALRINDSVKTVTALASGKGGSTSNLTVIRDICGLFVTADQHGRLYFIHQTARDYFLSNAVESARPQQCHPAVVVKESLEQPLPFHGLFDLPMCHSRLGEACLRYLQLKEVQALNEMTYLQVRSPEDHGFFKFSTSKVEDRGLSDRLPLLDYSINFPLHFNRAAGKIPDEIFRLLIEFLHSRSIVAGLFMSMSTMLPKVGGLMFRELTISVKEELPSAPLGQETLKKTNFCETQRNAVELAVSSGLLALLSFQQRNQVDLWFAKAIEHTSQNIYYSLFLGERDSGKAIFTFPINIAIQMRDLAATRFLLQEDVLPPGHPVFKVLYEDRCLNPLCSAAKSGLEVLKIVQSRPEFTAELADRSVEPLFYSAVMSGETETLREVLVMGADPTLLFRGTSALCHAIIRSKDQRYETEGGDKSSDELEAVPERHSTRKTFLDLIYQSMPSAIDGTDPDGLTPLHHAVQRNAYLEISWLLSHGASTNVIHGDKPTALEMARKQVEMGGFSKSVLALMEGQANREAMTEKGSSS